MDRQAAEKIISEHVELVVADPSLLPGNGCAACYVLFALAGKTGMSEADAAALLSEALLESPDLDSRFISMVETLHMKHRMAGVAFAIKTREAKDRYIDSQLKNSLEELLSDTASFGVESAMRKLVLTHAALQIAQSLGIDYHAAAEELYYYLRHYAESEQDLEKLVSSLLGRARK